MALSHSNPQLKDPQLSKPQSTLTSSTRTPKPKEETKGFLDDSVLADSSKQQLFREPLTHVKNRSPLENILGACFGDFDAKLTYNQLLPFYNLREDANVLFDAKCTDYDDLFRELWEAITSEKLDKIENDRWKDFGFQNANPRSDLRGGGLISLKQMVTYAKKNKAKLAEMVDPKHDFLFAVSSINVTYFLFRYYHMSDLLVYEKDWKEICSRTALKTFCILLEADSQVFNKIHSLLLQDLFEVWLEIKHTLPHATLLDFNLAMDTMKRRYRKATEKKMFDDFETLRIYYNKKKVQNLPEIKHPYTKR